MPGLRVLEHEQRQRRCARSAPSARRLTRAVAKAAARTRAPSVSLKLSLACEFLTHKFLMALW